MGPGGAHRVDIGFAEGLPTAMRLFAQYLLLLPFPANLSAVHEGRVVGFGDPLAVLGLVALFGFISAAWWARRSSVLLVALSLLIVPLLPALYVPVLGEGLLAERYLYVPSVGAALLIGLGLATLRGRTSHAWRWATAGCGVLVVVLALATLSRNAVWKSDLALWSDAAAKAPRSAVAHEYLGFAYLAGGDPGNAILSLRRGLAIDPARQDARTNLASALLSTGRPDEAATQAEQALRGPRRPPEALAILGLARAEQGRFDEAISALKQSLELDPNQPAVHNSLGAMYVATGKSRLAGRHFARAVSLDPRNPQYARNLAQFPASNDAPVEEVSR
jgi:Flp pilus assembly protein TadD